MNWIKQNTFLAGFFGFMLIGVGVLGYLAWTAKASYEEVSVRYDETANELNRLQTLAPFPAQENLEKIEAQRKEHQDVIASLQQELGKNEIPLEPMTEVQFQDKLRESVSRVRAKAAERSVALVGEDKFYMGFDIYQSEPPPPAVAPELGRQLKAIELVIMELINAGAVSVTKLDRLPIKGERAAEKAEAAASGSNQARNQNQNQAPESSLVTRYPFEITFIADQTSFRTALNNIVGSKTQFYIPRNIAVKNEQEKGPPKAGDVAVAAPAAPAEGAPPPLAGATAAPVEGLKILVGDEKNEVTIRFDILDFADPAAATTKK